MDYLLAPSSQEARAYHHIADHILGWDSPDAASNESLIAGFASYQAFSRYLSGSDLYLKPRTKRDLESTLRRYAVDAIHNLISRAREEMSRGGYTRMCQLSEESIRRVLSENDNAAHLLALHPHPDLFANELEASRASPSRFIKIK